MARLSERDRETLRELTVRGWRDDRAAAGSDVFERTPAGREAYCQWLSDVSDLFSEPRPARFTGSEWKL